jgi:hypothetical protein
MARCPDCRTRRVSFTKMLEHVRSTGHRLCRCGGYHYEHRPGSRCCVVNPMSAVHIMQRYTDDEDLLAEIAIECALDNPGRVSKRCPF